MKTLKRRKAPHQPSPWKSFHKTFSLGALRPHKDSILPYLDRPGGSFVEIGAHDGLKDSFSTYLEKALGWHGLLIEPWPHLFHQCRKRRKYSVAVNVAVVDHTLQDSYIKVEGLPPKVSVQEELKKELEKRQAANEITKPPSLGKSPRKISYINTDSIDNVLSKAEFDHNFDLLILNLKGYESNALKGISFDAYRPAFILAHVDILSEAIPNLPIFYQKIASSQHDRTSRVILFRLSDFGAN